jgi:hypothetical protein
MALTGAYTHCPPAEWAGGVVETFSLPPPNTLRAMYRGSRTTCKEHRRHGNPLSTDAISREREFRPEIVLDRVARAYPSALCIKGVRSCCKQASLTMSAASSAFWAY